MDAVARTRPLSACRRESTRSRWGSRHQRCERGTLALRHARALLAAQPCGRASGRPRRRGPSGRGRASEHAVVRAGGRHRRLVTRPKPLCDVVRLIAGDVSGSGSF